VFTGLVEEIGRVKWIERGGLWARLGIQAQKVLGDLSRGDSVAVNGVCLTVTEPGKRVRG
jgi:riboflavin synthase